MTTPVRQLSTPTVHGFDVGGVPTPVSVFYPALHVLPSQTHSHLPEFHEDDVKRATSMPLPKSHISPHAKTHQPHHLLTPSHQYKQQQQQQLYGDEEADESMTEEDLNAILKLIEQYEPESEEHSTPTSAEHDRDADHRGHTPYKQSAYSASISKAATNKGYSAVQTTHSATPSSTLPTSPRSLQATTMQFDTPYRAPSLHTPSTPSQHYDNHNYNHSSSSNIDDSPLAIVYASLEEQHTPPPRSESKPCNGAAQVVETATPDVHCASMADVSSAQATYGWWSWVSSIVGVVTTGTWH
jgi:hypothetical protein